MKKKMYSKSLNLDKMRIKNFLLTVVAILASSLLISAQTNCNSELHVKNNRNIKTIKNLSYTYSLTLTNSGSSQSEFQIFAENANESCENPDGLSSEYNIILTNEILDKDLNQITGNITINAGETFIINIRLTASAEDNHDKWNCTEVIAEAINCEGDPLKLVLHTFNPNPTELE